MKILDSRELSFGILPLQHQDFHREGLSLQFRKCIIAIRVLRWNIGTAQEGLGEKELDRPTAGDIVGGLVWPNGKLREIPFWRFSVPVVTHRPFSRKQVIPTTLGGVYPDSFSRCATLPEAEVHALPIWTRNYDADTRMESLAVNSPLRNGKRLWPKFPIDYFGIVLAADEEKRQHELFFPIDPRLIAVHFAGDPLMGSLVGDLDSDFKIDPDRLARLQALTKVVKLPTGCTAFLKSNSQNSLAWNIARSGCEDVYGGYIHENGILALVSKADTGPFDAGSKTDQHQIGKDADGNPINSAHVPTSALFRENDEKDGPLLFEGFYKAPLVTTPESKLLIARGFDPKDLRIPVHLEFDRDLKHPWACGMKDGKWRWSADTRVLKIPGIETVNNKTFIKKAIRLFFDLTTFKIVIKIPKDKPKEDEEEDEKVYTPSGSAFGTEVFGLINHTSGSLNRVHIPNNTQTAADTSIATGTDATLNMPALSRAFTLTRLRVVNFLRTLGAGEQLDVVIRKNNEDTALAVTLTSGEQEDFNNTDSVSFAEGDHLGVRVQTNSSYLGSGVRWTFEMTA